MENNKRPTQSLRVLNYMRTHDGITQLDAMLDLGCMRLASRISELRKDGFAIKSEMIKVSNRYGQQVSVKLYRLEE